MSLIELNRREIKELGLVGKTKVSWWPLECIPLFHKGKYAGKTSFYYISKKGSPVVPNLVLAYPACLFVRETKIYGDKKTKDTRIKGLPYGGIGERGDLTQVDFSHYYIGSGHIQSIDWEMDSEFNPLPIKITSEVAPITFLKKNLLKNRKSKS